MEVKRKPLCVCFQNRLLGTVGRLRQYSPVLYIGWKFSTKETDVFLGGNFNVYIIFVWGRKIRLNKTGGLGWWFGVGGKALFFD